MHLRGKYPFKQAKEIKEIIEEKLNSYLNEEEFTDIVSYMYNKEDSEAIIVKIKIMGETLNNSSEQRNETLIRYDLFQKVSYFAFFTN